ncbi:MAG: hypothetical protein V7746_07035 [Halioglobus sp.]
MTDRAHYPWYDSPWLEAYSTAKVIIGKICPEKLKEFEAALSIFNAPEDFQVIKLSEVLSTTQLADALRVVNELEPDNLTQHELLQFGRMVVHNHPEFTRLQKVFTERMSDLANEQLEPSYNFLSLYNNLGVCKPHMDAPNAKWTLDICLDQSASWPINFSQTVPWPEKFTPRGEDWHMQVLEDPELRFTTFAPEVNEALFFAGSSQWHYRDRISSAAAQNYCHLLFFHYIPSDSGDLVDPKSWWRIFDIPELKEFEPSANWMRN